MSTAQMTAINMVKYIPEEKIGEVLSFLQFITNKQLDSLMLEIDDENEIDEIIKTTEWTPSDNLQKKIDLLS